MTEKCRYYIVDGKKIELDGRRSFQGLERVGVDIKPIVTPILGRHGFVGAELFEQWEDIVGKELSFGIRPEKMVFQGSDRVNGTLVVKSAGGAFAMLLEHQKDRLIERINVFFGYPAVAHIKIIQGALKLKMPKPVKADKKITQKQMDALVERTKNIADPDLRQKMIEVGIAFLKKEG